VIVWSVQNGVSWVGCKSCPDNYDLADDPFVTAGLTPAQNDSEGMPSSGQTQGIARLARGKQKREQLKAAWMAENELQEYGEYE